MSDGEYYSGGGEKTVAKTIILKKYLEAYLSILKKKENWRGPKWYIDTHAGTGITKELGVEIPGSALRALNLDFDRFYLYEKDYDHFDTLVETINSKTEATLKRGSLSATGDPMAFCDDPYVRVMNMDCNSGVQYLAQNSRRNAHWFTFVDPEKFSVERELMEQLCERANMDILFNFQTSGFVRNTGEESQHSHSKAASNLGEDFPVGATEDELVEYYKEDVYTDLGWESTSRKMVNEGTNEWRYDLVFASENATAAGIMADIFDGNIKNAVRDEIREWRAKHDADQTGIETFLSVGSHDEEEDNGEQARFGDFA